MRALSAVKLRICDTEHFDQIDFGAVLSAVGRDLADSRIEVIEDYYGTLELEAARAMPLALFFYDAILNAFKHAWPGTRTGRRTLSLQGGASGCEVGTSDDGVGYADGRITKGLGSRLARAGS